jgi:plastocyanin
MNIMRSFLFYSTNIISMKKVMGSKSRSAIVIAMLFVIFIIDNSCTKDNTADLNGNGGTKKITASKGGAGTSEVVIQGMSFSPETLTVASGTTITWTNEDNSPNIVTSEDGMFGGVISSNGTYSYTFSSVGNYKYFNRVHPSSAGNIIVN